MAKRFVKRLPDGFQCRNLGSCVYACYLLTEYNVKRGFYDFSVVKGKVAFTDQRKIEHRDHHHWILLNNGKIYDPTYEQFFHYPINELSRTGMKYLWRDKDVWSALEIIDSGCHITDEFKAFHYKITKTGKFFRGAMWLSEVENPEFIPKKFRI